MRRKSECGWQMLPVTVRHTLDHSKCIVSMVLGNNNSCHRVRCVVS